MYDLSVLIAYMLNNSTFNINFDTKSFLFKCIIIVLVGKFIKNFI